MNHTVGLAALLMDQTSFFMKQWVQKQFIESFADVSEADFNTAWASFEGDGSLIGFSLESDGLDGALFEHQEHGTIDMSELFMLAGDETYYSLGAAFPIRLYEMNSAVAEVAINAGFSDAARMLAQLPIDSSAWTGISPSFTFDAAAKSKVVGLISKARSELAASKLSNAEHSKADAYLECALLLTKQDDPDPDIVATLIKRALLFVTGVGLFADFKTIFGIH